MRLRTTLLSLALLALGVLAPALPAGAEDAPPPVKGMFLLTDYPSTTVRPGSTTTINLRLRNYALPPERFNFAVNGAPQGWTVTLLGGGQPAGEQARRLLLIGVHHIVDARRSPDRARLAPRDVRRAGRIAV